MPREVDTVRIVSVTGDRPNIMKIASITKQIDRCGQIESLLIHTGQQASERIVPILNGAIIVS